MWDQLPPGVLGSAIITTIYTLVCFFANLLMLWLTWVHRETLSYVALIGYLTLLCTVASIAQQQYEYAHWEEFMWEQHYYVQEHPDDASTWFNNGNFGFRLALSEIRLFTNDASAGLALSFSIAIAGTVYNFWATHQRIERVFNVVGKAAPILLAAISVALLQVPAVQRSWTAYMILANWLSVASCGLCCVFFVAITLQYLRGKRTLKRWKEWLRARSRKITGWRPNSKSQDSQRQRAQQARSGNRRGRPANVTTNASWAQMSLSTPSMYDGWLVTRLLILVVMLWVFIIVTIVTHLQEKDNVVKNAMAPTPNLTAGYANDAILGYMPAVTPGLLLFIVFGTTKTLRQTMYETFVPRSIRLRRQQRRNARHMQVQTPSSQQSPYLPQHMDDMTLDREFSTLPASALDTRSSDSNPKNNSRPVLPLIVTENIEMGNMFDGIGELNNGANLHSKINRPGRGSSPHSSLIEDDGLDREAARRW